MGRVLVAVMGLSLIVERVTEKVLYLVLAMKKDELQKRVNGVRDIQR